MLLATADEDWREKWDTPPETKPQFSEAKAVPPGKQVFKGSPYNMYLSSVIGWMGEAGDPTGTWVIDVVLRDTMRNTELPLRTRFDLLSK